MEVFTTTQGNESNCIGEWNQALESLENNFEGLVKLALKTFHSLGFEVTEDEQQDLIQDALLTLYQNIDKWDSSRPFGSWASVVIRNAMIRYIREINEHNKLQPLPPEIGDLDDPFSRVEDEDFLHVLWNKLSKREQTVISKRINNLPLSRQEFYILKSIREKRLGT